jgi:hypothetical protein
MRVLFLGDVTGRPGRAAVARELPGLRERTPLGAADAVIVNAENAAGGLGLTPATAKDLFKAGAEVLTTGNHVWKHREVYDYLDSEERVLRPANYPEGAPGRGMGVYDLPGGRLVVLNLLGRTYLDEVDCPFRKADELLAQVPADVQSIIVDFHAEATSEKVAMAYHLDGRVGAVLGTHTHVQTNDARILAGGTAAVSDVGMCGVPDSILGMDPKIIVERFLTRLPKRFELARGEAGLQGAVVEVDEGTGLAREVRLVQVAPPR